jgi:flagellin
VGETVSLVIAPEMGASGLNLAGLDPTRIGDPAVGASPAQARVDVLRTGKLAFVGATRPGVLASLTGKVWLGEVELNLGAAIASAGLGASNCQIVAALNAAASGAGITHRPDVFVDDGDDLIVRGPEVTAASTPADLITPKASASMVTATVPAATSDGPRAGMLTFPGLTSADLPRLGGTITVGDKTLDLGAVLYTDTDGDGTISGTEALAQLNASAVDAGVTDSSHGFAYSKPYSLSEDSYSDSAEILFFEGPVPAATATPAELLAVTPVFTPAPDPLEAIDRAIRTVSSQRADLGAFQNRLEHTLSRLAVAIGNTTAAESRIRDADMAEESMRLTRSQILTGAGAAMLAQANRSPEGLLALLR